MKSRIISLALLIFLSLFFVSTSSAQSEEVRLNVQRKFGFSSGSQIRGTFALDISTPLTVQSVKYMLDGQLIQEVKQSPFTLTFQTTEYSTGWHELSAVVLTSDNRTLQTVPRRFEFVSAEAEGQAVFGIIVPLLGGIALLMLIGVLTQVFMFQKKGLNRLPLGAPRTYGMLGGTICPKCHRPFSRHWWGINMVVGKFDRCDYCGNWSITNRLSSQELAAAEAEELKQAQTQSSIQGQAPEDKTKKMIDDSKFLD